VFDLWFHYGYGGVLVCLVCVCFVWVCVSRFPLDVGGYSGLVFSFPLLSDYLVVLLLWWVVLLHGLVFGGGLWVVWYMVLVFVVGGVFISVFDGVWFWHLRRFDGWLGGCYCAFRVGYMCVTIFFVFLLGGGLLGLYWLRCC